MTITRVALGIATALFSSLCLTTNAFLPLSDQVVGRRSNPLWSTIDAEAPSEVEGVTVTSAKTRLLEVAEKLKTENGFLLVEKNAKEKLKDAVEDLESVSSGGGADEVPTVSKLLGNWTLLVSTSTNRDGVDTSKLESLPSYFSDPIKKIRSNILDVSNTYLVVQQKIRATNNDEIIDRVDIVLEFEPPEQLSDVVKQAIPEQLKNVNINPLAVSSSKVVLIHKANTISEDPLKTKITLESIVLNVAGASRVLDPNGKDVAGINIPNLGDFLDSNSAVFETTFMDDDIRISRGNLMGGVEQLRVFVRSETPTTKVIIAEEVELDEDIVDIEPSDTSSTSFGAEMEDTSAGDNESDTSDSTQPDEMDP